MDLNIARAVLDDPEVAGLVAAHKTHSMGLSPAESDHALSAEELRDPAITLWGAWDGATLAGIGVLRAMDDANGEIKTMHTRASYRGRGVGRAILSAILAEAERRGYRGLYLETGSDAAYAPARALYERHGFRPCGPFADYREDPHSVYFMKPLSVGVSA